jgi:hypothetical protein
LGGLAVNMPISPFKIESISQMITLTMISICTLHTASSDIPTVGICSILYLLDDDSTEDCLDIWDELFLFSLVQFFFLIQKFEMFARLSFVHFSTIDFLLNVFQIRILSPKKGFLSREKLAHG